MPIDVNGPAPADSGLFGLSVEPASAACVVVPVPFEATVSYRGGTAQGPAAILRASHQVDLFDADVGRPYLAGIAMEAESPLIRQLNHKAKEAARRHIDALTRGEALGSPADQRFVDEAQALVNRHVRERVTHLLKQDKLPVVLGGDHSVPYGAIAACAAQAGEAPLGVLHVDAHCDLRLAYEGFTWSHASIMRNVVDRMPNVRLVQVGIRDFSEEELDVVKAQPGRIATYFDGQLRRPRLQGKLLQVFEAIAQLLPEQVYVSFDVDGLAPAFCPHTGTPVPGGLSFDEAVQLLDCVVTAGKRIVGLDLNEVSPGEDPQGDVDTWDAIVGARLLYKLVGFALLSRGHDAVAWPDLPRAPGIRD